jgi:hypothetical protein
VMLARDRPQRCQSSARLRWFGAARQTATRQA